MTKGWVQSLSTVKQYLVSKWNEMKMHFEDNFFVCNIQIISNTNKIYCKLSLFDVYGLWIGMYIAYWLQLVMKNVVLVWQKLS